MITNVREYVRTQISVSHYFINAGTRKQYFTSQGTSTCENIYKQ